MNNFQFNYHMECISLHSWLNWKMICDFPEVVFEVDVGNA